MSAEIQVGCDGACHVNTRKGGWAFFDGEEMHSGTLTDCTNNQAEYTGLIKLIEHLSKKPKQKYHILMDSQLVVNQMNGTYAVRNEGLMSYYLKAKTLLSVAPFEYRLEWVRREHPLMMKIDAHAKAASNK